MKICRLTRFSLDAIFDSAGEVVVASSIYSDENNGEEALKKIYENNPRLKSAYFDTDYNIKAWTKIK